MTSSINNVNPMYFIIDEVDVYIERNSIKENNGNEYEILLPQIKTKKF